VALDDVYGIMAFGIAMSLAKLSLSTETVTVWTMISSPVIEIGGALVLGSFLGVIVAFVSKRMASNRDETQVISLAAVGLATGLAKVLGVSSILTSIAMGTVVVNLVRNSQRIFGSINDFTPVFYVLFFTLAGASLDLEILSSVGLLGMAYIICRATGKMLGAWFGAKTMKSPKKVTKYLGLGLLPQGGISIGLSVLVRQEMPQLAVAITTIIMFSVLVYEISGPIFAKIAITKAGEVGGLDRVENIETETLSNCEIEPETPNLAEATPAPEVQTELAPQPE
jgi:Kef-type K+ transport system membrane component KefB